MWRQNKAKPTDYKPLVVWAQNLKQAHKYLKAQQL